MSDPVQDLLFLAKRLQGILELTPTLTSKQNLEARVTELSGTVKQLKLDQDTASKAVQEAEDKAKSIQESNKTLMDSAKAQAGLILKEAREEADKIKELAKQEVSVLKQKETEASKTMEDAIELRKQDLAKISSEVSSYEDKLANVKSEISSLKSRF